MDAIFLSSGDVIADRRFEYARDLVAEGDFAAAADLLEQTLELAPGYAAAWFTLGEVRERLGARDAAAAAFGKAAAADPQDRHGANLHLIRLGVAPATAMPESYVRSLFDGYAPKFDHALTQGLSYRAPELLLQAVQASGAAMTFAHALDLGCGTGLGGAAFKPFCAKLTGVDLSPAMLAQAKAKNIYDRLDAGDVVSFLDAGTARYDFILAADVFMYLDDLHPVLAAVKRAMTPGALLAFSVETHDGDGVMLRDTLRYAHGAAHVRAALAVAGLTLITLEPATTRTEKGVPVPGLIAVALLPPPLRGRVGEGGH